MINAVVLPIEGRILQPEVRAEVDDLSRPNEELRDAGDGTAVGHREEEKVARVRVRVGREHEVRDLAAIWAGPAQRGSRHRVGGVLSGIDLRMAKEQPEGLSTGVT